MPSESMINRVIDSQIDYVVFQRSGPHRGWYLCTKDAAQTEDIPITAGPFETQREAERAGREQNARDAIMAMREPTDAMMYAVRAGYGTDKQRYSGDAWRAGIDAALTEPRDAK